MALLDRARAALMGLFIGDALAMPVHWYYDRGRILRDFGGAIRGYNAAPTRFPGSIMNLSNTGGGGRGSDQGSVVGDVILHGKKKYWLKGGAYHYHHGMGAGDNTLEAQLARVLLRDLATRPGAPFDADAFRADYISFMTTPDSHNDVYASTCHRMFFANWARGVDPRACPDNDGHNVDAIDGLTLPIPVAVTHAIAQAAARSRQQASTSTSQQQAPQDAAAPLADVVAVTRRSAPLARAAGVYGALLTDVLLMMDTETGRAGGPAKVLRAAAVAAGEAMGVDVPRMVEANGSQDPMVACYLGSSFPALLHFVYKYAADGPEAALLASTNAGGENVARGAALGAVFGAAYGMKGWPAWATEGLGKGKEVRAEIDAALGAAAADPPPAGAAASQQAATGMHPGL